MGFQRITQMQTIAPLFADWPEKMVRSTLDGCMGEAFANEPLTVAQIINGDFIFLAGDANSADVDTLVAHIPVCSASKEWLIVPRDEGWGNRVAKVWGNRAQPIERYAIRKDENHFDRDRLTAFTQALPSGYSLCAMDDACYHMAHEQSWSVDLVSQFQDATDFAERGLGIMVCWGNEPVAGASSYVVFRDGIEIEIDTRTDHRRKGLATACGAALILECLKRGLYPSWDAANRQSVALAEKLGYVFDRPYITFRLQCNERG